MYEYPGQSGGTTEQHAGIQGRLGQAGLDEHTVQVQSHIRVRPGALEHLDNPVDQLAHERSILITRTTGSS